MEFVVSDDHAGLIKAIRETLSGCLWQRCYVHFLRNALEHLPRKGDQECFLELRWMYERRSLKETKADLAAWIKKWGERYPKLVEWVEEQHRGNIHVLCVPAAHHKHMKSSNMIERLNRGDKAADAGRSDLPQ